MDNKRKGSPSLRVPWITFASLLIVSGVLLARSGGSFVLNFERLAFSSLTALERGVFTVANTAKNAVMAVKELATLRKDYDALAVKLADYQQMQRNNAELRRENDMLREQLQFSSALDTSGQANKVARIISREVDNLYASITIDKGSADGINRGLPVIAVQNGSVGLVGKVVSVGQFTSRVLPVYSTECVVSARVQSTRDLGLATGLGNEEQTMRLDYIKKRARDQLHYGDVIVTSGENGNYMRDIPIGTIKRITVLDYDSSLDMEIESAIDFSRLETVIVVKKQMRGEV